MQCRVVLCWDIDRCWAPVWAQWAISYTRPPSQAIYWIKIMVNTMWPRHPITWMFVLARRIFLTQHKNKRHRKNTNWNISNSLQLHQAATVKRGIKMMKPNEARTFHTIDWDGNLAKIMPSKFNNNITSWDNVLWLKNKVFSIRYFSLSKGTMCKSAVGNLESKL